MVLRAGVGRTDTAERSPGQGMEVACSDHTKELIWKHLNFVERECEILSAVGQSVPPAVELTGFKVYHF